jgi:hypothetical protein
MRDWVADDPMPFRRSMKTATQLHVEDEKQPMRWMARTILAMLLGMLGGCAIGQPSGYVDASAWSANYTEDYIYDFSIQTASGNDTGLEGIQVKEFSKGGTGSSECCSLIPGVGQTIKVVWRIGGRQDDESHWKTYSRDVVVIGTMPRNTQDHSVLLVRFFPNHEVEAEIFPGDGKFGPSNPRMDKIFFVGPRVMRHIGE